MRSNGLPIRAARLSSLLIILVLVPLLLDQIVFRELYLSIVEPESTAGTTLLGISVERSDYKVGKKNILVLGDSRIAEGFAPEIANRRAAKVGYNFVRLGLPGTTPRVWFYLLRELDPMANRYSAIYVMTSSLRDDDVKDDFANRTLDTAYLSPLFRFSDITSYPETFSDPKLISQARAAVAFVGGNYKSDVTAFLAHPVTRFGKARAWFRAYPEWLAHYSGRPEHMPSVSDMAQLESAVSKLDEPARSESLGYLEVIRKKAYLPDSAAAAYNSRWYGAMAGRYVDRGVKFGVFLVPRGPYHELLGVPAEARGALSVLARKGVLSMIDQDVARPFERPEYFFDHLHLNAVGRVAFSDQLAASILADIE